MTKHDFERKISEWKKRKHATVNFSNNDKILIDEKTIVIWIVLKHNALYVIITNLLEFFLNVRLLKKIEN